MICSGISLGIGLGVGLGIGLSDFCTKNPLLLFIQSLNND